MAKSKPVQPNKAVKAAKDAEVKAISSVKVGAVTKPSQTPKSKSKEVAKQIAAKTEKRDKKSKPKEPTPELSSDEDSDEAMTSDESSNGSDSESEDQAPVAKTNGLKKANGTVEPAPTAAADTSESSESSDSESDAEVGASAPVTEAAAVKLPSNEDDASEDSSEGENDSEASSEDDSEEESEDDVPAKADNQQIKVKGPVDAKSLQGKLEKVVSEEVSSAESDDEDSGSAAGSSSESDSSSEEEEEETEATPAKKRKAEDGTSTITKKARTEQDEVNGDAAGKGNLFVGNLSWNVDEEWLSREFEKFGELKSVRIIMDRNNPGRSKGFGYVEFVNGADGITAHKEMKGAEIDNRSINIDFAEAKKERAPSGFQDRSQKYGDTPGEPTNTLFVANLAFGSTEDDVTEAFGGYGSIIGVRLPTDRDTGKPKGYGYVQFNSVEDATAAMNAMSGQSINDRPIRLDYATQKPANNDSPRGGGRGRGRGGFDRGGRGGGRGRGGPDRGGRGGGFRGGRGGSTNRGGFGDFQGKKMTF